MKPEPGVFVTRKIVVNFAGAFLLLMLIASLACFGIIAWMYRYQLPIADKFLPAATPLPVSTPHILSHSPSDSAILVIHDDFSSDTFEWGILERKGKAEVYDGELHLQSNSDSPFTIAVSGASLLEPSQEYFLQADFGTDQLTASAYGLVFGLSSRDDTFYLSEIFPVAHILYLYKHNSAGWQALTFANVPLQNYPLENTLGVYYNGGSIELDLNGVSTLTYRDDNPYTSAGFGFYVSDSGYQLLIDNLFLYRLR
jgi:hypothetical protein